MTASTFSSYKIIMPLGKNVSANIKELYRDNKKSGKARGANGKKRGRKQIIAIAMHAAKEMPKKMTMGGQDIANMRKRLGVVHG